MRLTFAVAASAIVLAALLAIPAEAQTRRYGGANLDQPTRIVTTDETGRRRTRITVKRRSFLDPGSATKSAFEYHYHDYAVPPNYRVFHDNHDYKGSWSRMPFAGPYDIPRNRF